MGPAVKNRLRKGGSPIQERRVRVRPSKEYEDSGRRVDRALPASRDLRRERFDAMHASAIGPSIAPEKLQRAQLLQVLCSIRTEPAGIRFSWL